MSNDDDAKDDFEEFRKRFQRDRKSAESGDWFVKLIRWMLENYSAQVNADYIRQRYPGAGADNQAKQAIRLAAKYASVIGGTSGAAISGMQLTIPATGGTGAMLAVPAIGSTVLADVAATTRIQLRTTYDLSVIHGAPLSMEDADDCYLVFMAALGVKIGAAFGDFAKVVGPKVVAYNVRKLLRSGVRKAIVSAASKVAGTQLARKLTERAMIRLLVPAINVPLGASGNFLFTKAVLTTANRHMRIRSAVVQPLLRLFGKNPDQQKTVPIRFLIAVMELPKRDGWEQKQLEALRYTQSSLSLSDNDVSELEHWFDYKLADIVNETPSLTQDGVQALVEYLVVCAALGSDKHDPDYESAISLIAQHLGGDFEAKSLAEKRKSLRL